MGSLSHECISHVFYGSSALAWLSQVPQLTLTRRGLAKNQISCRRSQWKYFLLFRSTTFVIRISGLGWRILHVDNGRKHSWIQHIGGTADIPSTEHTLDGTVTNYYHVSCTITADIPSTEHTLDVFNNTNYYEMKIRKKCGLLPNSPPPIGIFFQKNLPPFLLLKIASLMAETNFTLGPTSKTNQFSLLMVIICPEFANIK